MLFQILQVLTNKIPYKNDIRRNWSKLYVLESIEAIESKQSLDIE